MNVTFEEIPESQVMGEGFTPTTVTCEHGWMAVTHQREPNVLCISHVHSEKPGTMKLMIEACIKRFGAREILFYNCLTSSLPSKLRGFKPEVILDPVICEPALCYRGVWDV